MSKTKVNGIPRICVFCLLLVLVFLIIGCNSGINENDYKYKIYIDSGGIQKHILYSDNLQIDTFGFLTVNNPKVLGESQMSRAICSPGTYFILER